jgi:hypothetical protein
VCVVLIGLIILLKKKTQDFIFKIRALRGVTLHTTFFICFMIQQ